MTGLTFDSGALIALEAGRLSMSKVFHTAVAYRVPMTVPSVVLVEWWRAGAREKRREALLRALVVEDTSKELAKLAGSAIGHVKGATVVDAVVMSSAALRGDVVYTSDVVDLERLRGFAPFHSVKVFHA